MPPLTLNLSRETKEKVLNTLLSIIIVISMVLLIIGMTVLKPKCSTLPQIPRSLVVAQDGSGNFTSISAAVEAAPSRSTNYFGIFIKPGVYREEVRVPVEKTRLAFIGSGTGVTIIISSSSSGINPEDTATVVIKGYGFVAMDISFENTGDPTTGYTVALANKAKNTAFQGCSFKGYSGVLNVGYSFQFYGKTQIYGAVDLIWGNGAAVFQKCALFVEKPLPISQQPGALTLQERAAPNLQGGFVFHGCSVDVAAIGSDQPGYFVFLGRAGGAFSTVVFIECYLGGVTSPSARWLQSPPPKTLYMAEYNNHGPGANSNNTITLAEAAQFTIKSFIKEDDWLRETTVEYVSSGFL